VVVLALAQRLLHARGLQRVQHRAGHVFLQQAPLDRGAAASLRADHACIGIRAVCLRVPPVCQPPAALGAGRDAGQQVRRGAHHVLTARRVGEQPDQPLMGVGIDDRRPLRGRVFLALPLPQPGQPGRGQRAHDRGRPPPRCGYRPDAARGPVPRETLRDRLLTRATNAFGKHPEELAAALGCNDGAESAYRRLGATIIDGRRPPAQVADAILAAAAKTAPIRRPG